jgi:DNA-binding transcriptional ArsR family regulator
MAVTALYKTMQLEQPVASQQLAILRRARLVNTERRGKTIVYSVNYPMLDRISSLAGALLKAGNHSGNNDLQQPDAGKAGKE